MAAEGTVIFHAHTSERDLIWIRFLQVQLSDIEVDRKGQTLARSDQWPHAERAAGSRHREENPRDTDTGSRPHGDQAVAGPAPPRPRGARARELDGPRRVWPELRALVLQGQEGKSCGVEAAQCAVLVRAARAPHTAAFLD